MNCQGGDYTSDKYDPSYQCEGKYSKCKCNGNAYSTKLKVGQTPVNKSKCCFEHDPSSGDPDRQVGVWLCMACGEDEEYEQLKTYFPNKSNTKEVDVTFKAAVEEKCGDENNYIAGKGSCTGNLYFTCAYDASLYYTENSCSKAYQKLCFGNSNCAGATEKWTPLGTGKNVKDVISNWVQATSDDQIGTGRYYTYVGDSSVYEACGCPSEYANDCSGEGETVAEDAPYCVDKNNTKLYKSCQ